MLRVNWYDIRMMVLLVLVVFLYAFSSVRNGARQIKEVTIDILNPEQPFITSETVSKLLIQNKFNVTSKPKEILDLNTIETALNSNPVIRNAEVYLSVNDRLTAEIEQKKPIARVQTNASYYIDEEGSFMPLSSNYTARVPLVTGTVMKNNLSAVYKVAKKIDEDTILKKHVVEIHQDSEHNIGLKVRQYDFFIELGNTQQLDKKLNNFKVFYIKAKKDNTLGNYSKVNLKFDNQVVCTKK